VSVDRPLKRFLESPTDEARIVRMWSEIRDRRDRRRRGVLKPALGATALAAAVALAVWAWPEDEATTAPSALSLADGSAPDALESGAGERTYAMADGSTIELSPETRLETIQNDEGRFATLLARGSARFSVTPGGPRRWVVESGLATVEVIGTVFTVDRGARGVRVSVERGVVLVRGERVPDRIVRLTRGQSIFVPRDAPGAPTDGSSDDPPRTTDTAGADDPASGGRDGPTADTAASGDAQAGAVAAAERAPSREPAGRADRPRRTRRAERGPRAGERAGGRPEATESGDPVERWLERADDARRSGDVRTAVSLLERVARRSADPRAALAAFTLGRLEMDELHRPARARAAFERALTLGLPDRLAQQARLRIDEIGAGDPGEAGEP
jgi:transmembrane sensor